MYMVVSFILYSGKDKQRLTVKLFLSAFGEVDDHILENLIGSFRIATAQFLDLVHVEHVDLLR
jgi:hypothetical protein